MNFMIKNILILLSFSLIFGCSVSRNAYLKAQDSKDPDKMNEFLNKHGNSIFSQSIRHKIRILNSSFDPLTTPFPEKEQLIKFQDSGLLDTKNLPSHIPLQYAKELNRFLKDYFDEYGGQFCYEKGMFCHALKYGYKEKGKPYITTLTIYNGVYDMFVELLPDNKVQLVIIDGDYDTTFINNHGGLKIETDEQNFEKYKKIGTIKALERFISRYHNNKLKSDAYMLLSTKYEEKFGKIEGLEKFLSVHPIFPDSEIIRERLAERRAEKDWENIPDSIVGYENFLKKHKDISYIAGHAQEKLKKKIASFLMGNSINKLANQSFIKYIDWFNKKELLDLINNKKSGISVNSENIIYDKLEYFEAREKPSNYFEIDVKGSNFSKWNDDSKGILRSTSSAVIRPRLYVRLKSKLSRSTIKMVKVRVGLKGRKVSDYETALRKSDKGITYPSFTKIVTFHNIKPGRVTLNKLVVLPKITLKSATYGIGLFARVGEEETKITSVIRDIISVE